VSYNELQARQVFVGHFSLNSFSPGPIFKTTISNISINLAQNTFKFKISNRSGQRYGALKVKYSYNLLLQENL